MQLGSKNVSNVSLVDREKILLPPLHIKLGMIKQFVKALDRNSPCFQYLCTKFSSLSHAKIGEGIFDGPQNRKLMMDDIFTDTHLPLRFRRLKYKQKQNTNHLIVYKAAFTCV